MVAILGREGSRSVAIPGREGSNMVAILGREGSSIESFSLRSKEEASVAGSRAPRVGVRARIRG